MFLLLAAHLQKGQTVIHREPLEPLGEDEIIDLFVEVSNGFDKVINQM